MYTYIYDMYICIYMYESLYITLLFVNIYMYIYIYMYMYLYIYIYWIWTHGHKLSRKLDHKKRENNTRACNTSASFMHIYI